MPKNRRYPEFCPDYRLFSQHIERRCFRFTYVGFHPSRANQNIALFSLSMDPSTTSVVTNAVTTTASTHIRSDQASLHHNSPCTGDGGLGKGWDPSFWDSILQPRDVPDVDL